MVEVIGLHDHIVELQETESFFHPLFVALGPQHIVHREAGAYLPQQLYVIQLHQPLSVIDHNGLPLAKINKPLHLLFKAVTIVLNRLACHHLAHICAAGGIADHAGTSADQGDGPVSRHLEALHQTQGHKVAHMQRVRRGVKPNIKYRLAIVHQLLDLRLVRYLGNQPAGLQFLITGHNSLLLLSN